MKETKDAEQKARGEGKDTRLELVLILFGLSLFAFSPLCYGVVIGTSSTLLLVSIILAAISSLDFWLTSIWLAQLNDPDSVCWEALHQSLVAWKSALREESNERMKILYEQGKGALSSLQTTEPNCPQLKQLLQQLSNLKDDGELKKEKISFRLGILSTISPFAVNSVRLAIWIQALWQMWAIIVSVLAASVAWASVGQMSLRAIVYAACGGAFGASLYNLRTLADHIAVQRDYSTRFWIDYLTRPFLGAVLGVVVYAFAVGLSWTLTLQSPVGAQIPKVVFALGFLSGYALRSVLAWLSGVAKTVFHHAPSTPHEQQSLQEGGS